MKKLFMIGIFALLSNVAISCDSLESISENARITKDKFYKILKTTNGFPSVIKLGLTQMELTRLEKDMISDIDHIMKYHTYNDNYSNVLSELLGYKEDFKFKMYELDKKFTRAKYEAGL